MSYYPLSTRQVLEQATDRVGFPVDQLGDLETAARRYNELWLELEQTSKSTNALRVQIISIIFDELDLADRSCIHAIAQAYDQIRRDSGVLLYPNVERLLCDLKTQYRLGLLTNGPSDISWDKINGLKFDEVFDAIVVAGDIQIYKPDERAFGLLLKKLNVSARQAMFVGDNYTADIVGAHHVGMSTAWIKRDENATWDVVEPTIVTSDTASLREVLL